MFCLRNICINTLHKGDDGDDDDDDYDYDNNNNNNNNNQIISTPNSPVNNIQFFYGREVVR